MSQLVVFLLSLGAYAPLAYGALIHPEELNIATYSVWSIIAIMITYAKVAQRESGWELPAGFILGNIGMIGLAFWMDEYTFNLGPAETVVFYGIVTTLATWAAIGQVKKTWDPRIIFWGGILSDVASFYPQVKQYLLPHDDPTIWLFMGWIMWILAVLISLLKVEQFPTTFKKDRRFALKNSAFTIENGTFMLVTVVIMAN